jgi:3-deoxy-D-manno-octulosonic-acid transferase
MTLARRLYTLALYLLMPWAMLHLLLRSRKQPEYLGHWRERFGRYAARRDNKPLIWIHAVSVGETRAAQPLVRALQERYPDHALLLTHMTPTGRETCVSLFGDQVERCYLAYDYPGAVSRFLKHWQPRLGIIMETEIWPNLVSACAEQGMPLLLANARLSQRSANRYDRLATLVREAMSRLSGVAAQAPADADRLRHLGAQKVEVTGNIKFDVTVPDAQVQLGETFRARIGQRPVLLCASTREGEEALLLDAWKRVDVGNTLLLIVPRHPQRFAEVAALTHSTGFRVQLRSDEAPVAADTQVWIGDSLGEMFAYYAACDVAFIGGSLLDFGCQNLIEPCAVGKPVLLGPSTYNFAQAATDAHAAGAALVASDADALTKEALALLADTKRRDAMGLAGLAFTSKHRGATTRTLRWIEKILAE